MQNEKILMNEAHNNSAQLNAQSMAASKGSRQQLSFCGTSRAETVNCAMDIILSCQRLHSGGVSGRVFGRNHPCRYKQIQ